jgi:hypothetical protein
MSERRRFAEMASDDFNQRMLRSARLDAAPTQGLERLVALLGTVGAEALAGGAAAGIGGGVGSAVGAGAAAKAGGHAAVGLIAKWLTIGAVAGASTALLVDAGQSHSGAGESSPARSKTGTVIPAESSGGHGAVNGVGASIESPASLGTWAPEGAPSASQPNSMENVRAIGKALRTSEVSANVSNRTNEDKELPKPDDEDGGLVPSPRPRSMLTAEVFALDRARALVLNRDPDAALRQLDAYAVAFPVGALGDEALVLRVQALVQAQRRTEAIALACEFLERHPRSPHGDELRKLTGSAGADR